MLQNYSAVKSNNCDLLVQNNQLDLATQAATFERSFLDWKGELEQVDDICVVGIRI